MDDAELIKRAFLRYVQTANWGCEQTGEPCRKPEQCGCWLEMADFITYASIPVGGQQDG